MLRTPSIGSYAAAVSRRLVIVDAIINFTNNAGVIDPKAARAQRQCC